MKLDDESLLDAYLDGELDPARRLAVEAALESSARLADRLRHLARVDEAEPQRLADQERLQRLLSRPDVRRVFILAETLDDGTIGRVDEAIERTPRQEPEYGRIAVAQGIVLDPDRPGEAVVFA